MSFSVYIVDDEALARERLVLMLNTYLPDEVFVSGMAGDKETVLNEVPKLIPDIIFLDIEMPRTSGLELAEELKLLGYTGKIVFVTAYDHYAIKAIRAGAFDYLLKPVDVDELKEVIKRFGGNNNTEINIEKIKYYSLSPRETEIVKLLLKGMSSEEIAQNLFLSKNTVNTHRRNIHAKTGTKNTLGILNLFKR
jgi:DNA-binding NarL/FixJ family response regulator